MKKVLQLLTLTMLLATSLSAAEIHDAARDGNLERVQQLLADGADVNAKTNCGSTPLYRAARWGHTKIVQLLIDRGARVDIQDNYDSTPLHWAARNGHTEIVQLLIDYGAGIDIQDNHVWTPLHYAARSGHQKAVQLLIDHGARIDIQDDYGSTPLHYAARNGQTETVQLLETILCLNKSLWNAARNNHLATAKKALRKGAQPNAIEPDSQTGDTPMHIAVWNNNIEMVKLLLGFGGKANIKNSAGKTAMDLVFECESYAILPIFLEAAIIETTAEPKDRQHRINRLHGLVDALPKQQPCQLVPTEQRAVLDEFRNSLGPVNNSAQAQNR